MSEFITKHQKDILGVLSGFDRVRFRGTIRVLAVAKLFLGWLAHQRVLIKDFGGFAESLTQRLKRTMEPVAQQCELRSRRTCFLSNTVLSAGRASEWATTLK